MPAVGSREFVLRAMRLRTIRSWGVCAALSLGVLGLGSAGCSTLPGATSSWTVESAVVRGVYLDVSFTTGGSTRRFFTAATDPCKSLLKVEAIVDYVNLGPLGQFQSGDVTCIPAGIGSLGAWRDEQPRPQVGPLPQKQANFKLEYQDQDVVMVRGMIPLLGLIAWPGLGDTVIVLPLTQPCQALVPSGVATIEYRVAGPDPFVLLDNEKRCALVGLIQPIGER